MKIRKSKQGEGLTLNTIVVAILVLLVLAVVAYIFVVKLNVFKIGIDTSCAGNGGICQAQPCSTSASYVNPSDCKTPTDVSKPYCCKIV